MNNYFERKYSYLLEYATRISSNPTDLLHHTYLKALDAGFTHVSDMMSDSYFKRAMYNNCKRGDFKKDYQIRHEELTDIIQEVDTSRRICIEKVDEVIRHLDWFDRKIFELYLQGESMVKLSDKTGISISTIYKTLEVVRNTIKNYINE